jgi:cell wall-associated NlpC family hydrolase
MRERRPAPGGGGVLALVLVTLVAVLAAPHAPTLRAGVAAAGLPALRLPRLPLPPTAAVPPPAGAPSARAARAVAFALAQRGKPYRWGAEGPGAFDCSGLTRAAWRAAGVALPRTAAAQYAHGGRRVARGELKPGDLVFFRSGGPSGWHVGLVVGGGRMVEAPGRGARVRTAPVDRGGYLGATRPSTQGGGR